MAGWKMGAPEDAFPIENGGMFQPAICFFHRVYIRSISPPKDAGSSQNEGLGIPQT